MTEETLRLWLALGRAPACHGRLLGHLAHDGANLIAFFRERRAPVAGRISAALAGYLADPDWHGVDADLSWLSGGAGGLITYADSRYPPLLREIPDPPPVLFFRGDPDVLQRPQVAVVGTRRPSPDGREQSRRVSGELAGIGVVVTSGLALGIDTHAHRGALEAGGQTVAVLGCGADGVYPPRNRELCEQITNSGVVITEFGAGSPPLATNFPRRNRIISGLSLGTLVVEAAMRSGSLITAGLAASHGREVFAMPGALRNPVVQGCHHLIKQGAKLVTEMDDILEEIRELAPLLRLARRHGDTGTVAMGELDEPCRLLLDNIGFGPVGMDELINQTGLAAGTTASLLSSLEISGHIEILPGGRVVRR